MCFLVSCAGGFFLPRGLDVTSGKDIIRRQGKARQGNGLDWSGAYSSVLHSLSRYGPNVLAVSTNRSGDPQSEIPYLRHCKHVFFGVKEGLRKPRHQTPMRLLSAADKACRGATNR